MCILFSFLCVPLALDPYPERTVKEHLMILDEKRKKRVLSSSIMRDLKAEHYDGPTEIVVRKTFGSFIIALSCGYLVYEV